MLSRRAYNALATNLSKFFRGGGCRGAVLQTARTLATAVKPPSADDLLLVDAFDQHRSRPVSSKKTTGLFGHPQLTTPRSIQLLAQGTLVRAQWLTERILLARESQHEFLQAVKNLDRLSDLLCGVIDLAELIRCAHPHVAWVNAADEAYDQLCDFMNTLNTHVGLYEVLSEVLSDEGLVESLSAEAHETALIFWRDFEKSGIGLPTEKRNRFVSVSSDIRQLGQIFLSEASSPRPPAYVQPSELAGMKDEVFGSKLHHLSQKSLPIYPGSLQAQMIMRSAPSEEPRRKVYLAANSSAPKQIRLLEDMCRARAELAALVGKESYAHMTLGDKMAKTPENVHEFLETLLDHTRPHAKEALMALSLRKKAHLGINEIPTIQAWDKDYYCPPEPPAPPIPLPPLTVGTVFMGLSRLFYHLYGVSLRPVSVAAGEVWHADAQKLEVVDESGELLGWIYADIFARREKPAGAAHYTVRCSRRTDDDDVEGDIKGLPADVEALCKLSEEFEANKQFPQRDGTTFQLPLVVLLCDFATSRSSSGSHVLEWHEVTTLFHEMGHAMHSMIGRTEYQNVSGTRCATDFVELPSILMEHFLHSTTVLSLFDVEDTTRNKLTGNHHTDPCKSIDTYGQILLAALDQQYHSPDALKPNFDSTAILENLQNTRGVIPYVPGTSFQTQFGHLFGYGATYYSYLFDRAIASRVWRQLFSNDPLNRDTGEHYKQQILRYGGGKDPWKMVGALLGQPQLEGGDAEAMREVGKWRIQDDVSVPGRH